MSNNHEPEVNAVRKRYAKRSFLSDRYAFTNPDVFMAMQERERALIQWVEFSALAPLHGRRLLEVGCGSGANLHQMMKLGFAPENLVGNELLESRLDAARHQLPSSVALLGGDAASLEIAPGSFDVVMQSTVFTSLLDPAFQERLAARMWAWVKPGGGVLWYDFTFNNPRNPDVRGVPLSRIRALFPRGRMRYRRVTLAPPVARAVTRVHPALYAWVNVIPWLRTHLLCWIAKD